MNILVLQHAEVEHPGIFRKFIEEDGKTIFPNSPTFSLKKKSSNLS